MSKITDTQNPPSAATGQRPGSGAPDPVHDGIAMKLRELYSDLENEGVPAELLNLLDRLDEAERNQKMKARGQEANVDG